MKNQIKESGHVTSRSHELQKQTNKKNNHGTSNKIRELTL